jgi:hypothetical protein
MHLYAALPLLPILVNDTDIRQQTANYYGADNISRKG